MLPFVMRLPSATLQGSNGKRQSFNHAIANTTQPSLPSGMPPGMSCEASVHICSYKLHVCEAADLRTMQTLLPLSKIFGNFV